MAATGSSTISSRTSASSSTSDPSRALGARARGWVRLTHPFPSVLDGLVAGGTALFASGALEVAVRIGVSMTALQLGIGAVNDIVDAPRDAGRKAGKPIPEGLVTSTAAAALSAACFVLGVILAATVSPALGVLAAVVSAIGLSYNLALKGTAWSWLPFAIGIPILPVYGWLGAAGTLPAAFGVLVPVAVLAGAALAIGNALVDVERDRAAGVSSVAVALGPRTSGRVGLGLVAAVWTLAVGSAAIAAPAVAPIAVAAAGLVPVGAALEVVVNRSPAPDRRERLWQVEAVGFAILAAVWVGTVLSTRS